MKNLLRAFINKRSARLSPSIEQRVANASRFTTALASCRERRNRIEQVVCCDTHRLVLTPDLRRVKFDINKLKPFACLAFPFVETRKRA
jgi:hypothetical protein